MTEKEFRILEEYVLPPKAPPPTEDFYKYVKPSRDEIDAKLEYDMDEEDFAWLELFNDQRSKGGLSPISFDTFEYLMDQFEKDCFFHCTSKNFKPIPPELEHQADCAICLDGTSNEDNAILFCDMCSLSVHQKCYGVIKVPEEIWLCKRCLYSPAAIVDCCLCSSKSGALKRSLDGKWAHIVCAFWMPEITFGNDRAREPIMGIENVPSARWKLSCFVCNQKGKGACLQCQHSGCTTAYHASCAQLVGLTMKMEIFIDKDGVLKKKVTTFCDIHSPLMLDDSLPTNDLKDYAGPRYISSDDSEDDKIHKCDGTSNSVPQDSNKIKKNISWKSRLKLARKILASWIDMEQPIFVPVVTVATINKIIKKARELEIEKHESFVTRLHSYWTLKRQSRDGYPLLNSRKFGENIKILNVNHHHQHLSQGTSSNLFLRKSPVSSVPLVSCSSSSELFQNSQSFEMDSISRGSDVDKNAANGTEDEEIDNNDNNNDDDDDELFALHLMFCQRLRQDLEKLRLLIELVRKRERLKMEQIKLHERQVVLQLCPDYAAIKTILDEIRKVTQGVFEKFEDGTKLMNSLESNMEQRIYFTLEDFLLDLKHLFALCPPTLISEINEKITNISPIAFSQRAAFGSDPHFQGGMCSTADHKPIFTQRILFGNEVISQMLEKKNLGPLMVENVKGKRVKKRKLNIEEVGDASGLSKARPLTLKSSSNDLSAKKMRLNVDDYCQAKKLASSAKIVSGEESVNRRIPKEKESFKSYRVNLSPKTDEDGGGEKKSGILEIKNNEFSSAKSCSYYGDNERGETSDDDNDENVQEDAVLEFKAYDLVWAKYRSFPWHPAMILPNEKVSPPLYPIQIPAIPQEVMANLLLKPHLKLVLFFDDKSTWKCILSNKLLPLGTNPAIDKWKLLDSKKISTRQIIQAAYDRALQYQQMAASLDTVGQEFGNEQSSKIEQGHQLQLYSAEGKKQYHIDILELQQQLSQQIISESTNSQFSSPEQPTFHDKPDLGLPDHATAIKDTTMTYKASSSPN